MVKKNIVHVLFSAVLLLFVSCESTRVYVKTDDQFFEDGRLVTEIHSLTLDGKLKIEERSFYEYVSIQDKEEDRELTAAAVTVKTHKSKKEAVTIRILEGSNVIAEKKFDSRDGKIVSYGTAVKKKAGKKKLRSEKEAVWFDSAIVAFNSRTPVELTEKTDGSIMRRTVTEKATVVSVPNHSFITYSILGKPFVILGSSAWNLLKCGGYAFVNFLGGYNFVTSSSPGESYWIMPDAKKAKAEKEAAKKANALAYPEYHLPFTNNHIEIEKIESETLNAFTSAEEVKIVSKETFVYDNTIKVGRSAKLDAMSTAGVVGYVGTVVTIPVSAVTWVGGVAAGIYVTASGSR